MQTKTRKVISRSIFIVGVLCILLSSIFHISNVFYWFSGVISLTYLFSGWYIFKGYYPEGHPVYLFFFGYIYSGFFLGSAFASSEIEMLRAYFLWSIILIVVLVVTVLLKKEKYQKGLKSFSLEAVIMLILSIIQNVVNKL
ncbi:MAG: hypothetical protein EPN88_04830 [Bacteroidetes bacterium]|nr:MAG: hypothetical protein EPN88_04830 [Bacteroidota bacterium]